MSQCQICLIFQDYDWCFIFARPCLRFQCKQWLRWWNRGNVVLPWLSIILRETEVKNKLQNWWSGTGSQTHSSILEKQYILAYFLLICWPYIILEGSLEVDISRARRASVIFTDNWPTICYIFGNKSLASTNR